MQTLSGSAGAFYRTKLLAREKADQFAACLSANPLFRDVTVEESRRSPGKHMVCYVPTSSERRSDMVTREQDKREATAQAEGAGYLFCLDKDGGRPFWWCLSTSGEVYEVDAHSCSCPDHRYRCQGNGLRCKHQLALVSGAGQRGSF